MNHILVVLITISTLFLFSKLKLSILIKKSLNNIIELKNILFDNNLVLNLTGNIKKLIIQNFFINFQILFIFLIPILLVLIIFYFNNNFLSFFFSYISSIEIFITCIIYVSIKKKFYD